MINIDKGSLLSGIYLIIVIFKRLSKFCPFVYLDLFFCGKFRLPLSLYGNKATYQNSFTLKKDQIKNKKIILDLGNVQDMAVIRINGYAFPLSWYTPFEADISPYIREGRNSLSVDVINLWPNRLIGDGQLPEDQRKTKTNIKKFDVPDAEKYLRVSGLLGPVEIRFFNKIKLEIVK